MKQNTQYDPKVIQKFADALYAQAKSMIVVLTLLGLVAGGAVGAGIGSEGDSMMIFVIVGAIFFGLFGFAIGKARAFSMKLQAQAALCQMHIENNTRK